MNAASALSYIRELERRDETVAVALGAVEELLGRTRDLAEQARIARRFSERLPREREAAAAAVERGAADVSLRRRELDAAERAARDPGGRNAAAREEAAEQARRAAERAEEELASAVRRATELERRAVQAEADASTIAAEAAQLARDLEAAPRLAARWPGLPEHGLDELLAWSARAEGALLLTRGALNGEREAVVREANELAAQVLGGALAPAGVARIRERVEQALD
ncbi:MAG: hypothetical protein ICV59_07755 [Thermoleophilia bacterium]|nr:hypothetical protein [Thermoleophilia bacterium]